MATDYGELHCHSCYSLLDGVSTVAELVDQASMLGLPALALTDHNNLYGAVPFVQAAQSAGIQPILGAELTLADGHHLTLLVESPAGWRNLCWLITAAQRNAPKGQAALPWSALSERTDGLICLTGCQHGPLSRALRRWDRQGAYRAARYLQGLFPNHLYVEVQHHLQPGDAALAQDLVSLAQHLRLPAVLTNNVHYARRDGQRLHDLVQAIRYRRTLDAVDEWLRPNDEYYLKPAARLRPLVPFAPQLLAATLTVAERCTYQLAFGLQDLPTFPTPPGLDANQYLHALCHQALPARYGTPSDRVCGQLHYELRLITQAGLANYMLMVWDVVRYARSVGIRCQGRGSAANSLVAYLLGISPVDPLQHRLVVERFLSPERPTLPDIDLDVDAERREEVIQYLYGRYGTDHVALACTFITIQRRSVLNEVAHALDLSPDVVRQARQQLEAESGTDAGQAVIQLIRELCDGLHGLPRHLGQHSGGMVITGPPLAERVPIEPTAMPNRTVVQWDKTALEDAGLIKFDVLGLKALSAISTTLALIAASGEPPPNLDQLTYDDPAVYRMLTAGDTVGVFQVESRAQTSVLPRLKPTCFDDLVVAISLIRPGPIQGQMVHPYLRRRMGEEPVSFWHPCLEPVLGDTLGVILFQEQVLLVCEAVAGWPRGQGELLRRALGKGDAGQIAALRERFVGDAVGRGIPPTTATLIFERLTAFGGYAFPRSHSAAFAVLVYQTAYLKRYHPVPYLVALLNHQPMGFWPPVALLADARQHHISVYGVDVQRSGVAATLEGAGVRLGLAAVTGLGETGGVAIRDARMAGPFRSLNDLARRTRLGRTALERLILAGACASLDSNRRGLLLELDRLALPPTPLPLEFPPLDLPLPPLTPLETALAEQAVLGFSVGEHPLALLRPTLTRQGVQRSGALTRHIAGERVVVVGQAVIHQAPPTANGVQFLTLLDEDGLLDVVLRPSVVERCQAALAQGGWLRVTGMLQWDGARASVVAWQVVPLVLGV